MDFKEFNSLAIRDQAKYLIQKRKDNENAQSFGIPTELYYKITQRYQPVIIMARL